MCSKSALRQFALSALAVRDSPKSWETHLRQILWKFLANGDLLTKRCQFKNICSDQGVEGSMADAQFYMKGHDNPHPPGSLFAWAYPMCLVTFGILHMFFNALEEACTKLEFFKDYIVYLRYIRIS